MAMCMKSYDLWGVAEMQLAEELIEAQRERLPAGGCERLAVAHVAIAGLGGLGSHIAMELARTGVGYLHLVDFDVVDVSNLNRQMYSCRDLGRHKTEALAQAICDVNPNVQVQIDTVRVNGQNLLSLFVGDTIVCEAFDQPEAKAMLVNGLLAAFPEVRIVSGSGMAGYGRSNDIRTRRLGKRLFLCGDGVSGLAAGRGLLGPRVSICAGHQANKVLELIL